jgi:hypothetical protein
MAATTGSGQNGAETGTRCGAYIVFLRKKFGKFRQGGGFSTRCAPDEGVHLVFCFTEAELDPVRELKRRMS